MKWIFDFYTLNFCLIIIFYLLSTNENWELKLDLDLNLLLYRHRLGSDYWLDSGVSF